MTIIKISLKIRVIAMSVMGMTGMPKFVIANFIFTNSHLYTSGTKQNKGQFSFSYLYPTSMEKSQYRSVYKIENEQNDESSENLASFAKKHRHLRTPRRAIFGKRATI
jgi:hypothetical protein